MERLDKDTLLSMFVDLKDASERCKVAQAAGAKEWERRDRELGRRASAARYRLDRLREYATSIGLNVEDVAAEARKAMSDPASGYGDRPDVKAPAVPFGEDLTLSDLTGSNDPASDTKGASL